jgi:hypothetical protein
MRARSHECSKMVQAFRVGRQNRCTLSPESLARKPVILHLTRACTNGESAAEDIMD